MATVTTNVSEASTLEAIRNLQRYRAFNSGKPSGTYLVSWTKTLTTAETGNFDGAGDFLEMLDAPSNARLISARVTVPEMDTGTNLITLDLMADSDVLVNDDVAGRAGGVILYSGGADVSNKMLKLKIEAAPNTAPAVYGSAFSAEFLFYIGAPTVAS